MTKRHFEYYLNMHKQMWLDMAKHIAHIQHTIDIYRYKLSWCSSRNLSPFNKCFACECAVQIKWNVRDVEDDEMYFQNMCTYCPLRWPSAGDENHQFFCEYSYRPGYINKGLWMLADHQHSLQHGLEIGAMITITGRPDRDELWKKQCKLCYKIAMLPIDEDIAKLVTESL